MAIALLRSFIMRTHTIWVLGCSVGLAACLLSDFREAEERERMRTDSQRTVDTSERRDAGPIALPEAGSSAAVGDEPRDAGSGGEAERPGGRAGAEGRAGSVATAGAGGAPRGAGGRVAAGAGGANAGGGAGAVAGMSGAGGASDAGASCGDTENDVEHCGRCDNDCNADMALASCVDARCVRACATGYGDCNMDLTFGNQGDGCEVDLSNDSAHCGGCGSRCEPPWGTIGFCEDRQCQLNTVSIESGSPVAGLHGHAEGGDPYEQLCGRDEVQVGIDVASDGNYVLGFNVRCAQLWVGGTREDMSLATGPARALPALGNRAGTPATPVVLECPPGTLMSGVSGATGYFNVDNTLFSIKALSLLCAVPHVSDSWIELEASSTQSAGSLMGSVVEMFSDQCAPGEAVVGFIGRAGHLIDALSTVCAPISIAQRAQ
ncbi:MAG TPA: hypothetical protein VMF89_17040 [Polyangiales bacterium]|nr:hypothetical protein [Polyangiales bacterium]